MNWKDSNGMKLIMGDYVMIDGLIHLIELTKIRNKNKMVFIPKPDSNVLVEYHFLSYRQAIKLGIEKMTNTNPP